MQANGTTTSNEIGLSGESIATLVASALSLLGSILTFTYIKMKSRFSDEQNTRIELSSKRTETGDTEINIIIELKNHEKYGTHLVATANGQKEKQGSYNIIDVLSSDDSLGGSGQKNSAMIEIIEKMNEGVKPIMINNNKGDEIIHQTRNHVTRDALNTFVKALQIHTLKGEGESLLDIRSLHSPLRERERSNSTIIEEIKVDWNKHEVNEMKSGVRKKAEPKDYEITLVGDDALTNNCIAEELGLSD